MEELTVIKISHDIDLFFDKWVNGTPFNCKSSLLSSKIRNMELDAKPFAILHNIRWNLEPCGFQACLDAHVQWVAALYLKLLQYRQRKEIRRALSNAYSELFEWTDLKINSHKDILYLASKTRPIWIISPS